VIAIATSRTSTSGYDHWARSLSDRFSKSGGCTHFYGFSGHTSSSVIDAPSLQSSHPIQQQGVRIDTDMVEERVKGLLPICYNQKRLTQSPPRNNPHQRELLPRSLKLIQTMTKTLQILIWRTQSGKIGTAQAQSAMWTCNRCKERGRPCFGGQAAITRHSYSCQTLSWLISKVQTSLCRIRHLVTDQVLIWVTEIVELTIILALVTHWKSRATVLLHPRIRVLTFHATIRD
jgi:hypothetical protein